jgi:carbon-monoxide dehydrogenase small subunit
MPVTLSLSVNGKPVTADVDSRTLLVDFLRNELALTARTSAATRAVRRLHRAPRRQRDQGLHDPRRAGQRAAVLTIEGLAAADGTMHPMQAAFKECHGLQCGFCTPGMVMSAIDLVNRHPQASEQTIREELEGNFCRCTGYQNIVKAVQHGAAAMGTRGDAWAPPSKRHRRVDPPQGRLPLPHRLRPVHGRRQSAESRSRVLPALAARAREAQQG